MNRLSLLFARFGASAGQNEFASYATALNLPDGATAPEWVMLLPVGEVVPSPLDGREPFAVKDPEAIIKATQPHLRTFVLDYDHATDEGGSSRAAGWVKELAAKGPNGEAGIWGRVEWTASGKTAVESREYRFLSPSLYHDKDTREVRFMVRAALTNNPALVLKALTSIQAQTQPNKQEQSLDLLKQLATMLGLDPSTATEADVVAAVKALCQGDGAQAEDLSKKLCSIAKAAGHNVEIKKIDDTLVSAICSTITGASEAAALKEQLADARIELITLRQTKDAKTPEEIVDEMVASGKIAPADKKDALDIYKLSPAKFSRFVDGIGVSHLGTRTAPAKKAEGGDGVVDEDASAVCARFGIKPADFAKTSKELMTQKEGA